MGAQRVPFSVLVIACYPYGSSQEAGTAKASFVLRHLESQRFDPEEQHFLLKWAAGAIHAGGADTVRRPMLDISFRPDNLTD
jgi:hypothetical protein